MKCEVTACGQASILNTTCHEIIYEADVKTVVKII